MRLVIARCSVDYTGRLNAHLPLATRLLVHKGDGSLLVHSDGGSYKPLNWMSPPCRLDVEIPDAESAAAGVLEHWRVTHAKSGDALLVRIYEVLHDTSHELGIDPGLQKDGVEAQLVRGVVQHLVDAHQQRIAGLRVRDPPVLEHSGRGGVGIRNLDVQPARRAHPVERLVRAAVGVHQQRAVALVHQQSGRERQVGIEPPRVIHGAAGDDETHPTSLARRR